MQVQQLREFLPLISPEAPLNATEARVDEHGDLCLLHVDHHPLLSREQLEAALEPLPLRDHATVRFDYRDPADGEDEDGYGPEDNAANVRYIYYSMEYGFFDFAMNLF